MGFDNIAEVLFHPYQKYNAEQKQIALSSMITVLWWNWDQQIEQWLQHRIDTTEMYLYACIRDEVSENLMDTEFGLFGQA